MTTPVIVCRETIGHEPRPGHYRWVCSVCEAAIDAEAAVTRVVVGPSILVCTWCHEMDAWKPEGG